MTETECSGWYCPECEKETPHILCDGCKSLICEMCGYPCACEGGEVHGRMIMQLDSAEVMTWLEGAQARRGDDLRPDSRAEIAIRLQYLAGRENREVS